MPAVIATKTAYCRHGVFTYHSQDRFLGTSLRLYGEYSEGEVDFYDAVLKPEDVAIEVGANIGALTIPLARRCKKVFTFEPQPESFVLLRTNLEINGINNVDAAPVAIGSRDDVVRIPTIAEIDSNYGRVEVGDGGHTVHQRSLDGMEFNVRIDFMKLDCEGMELDVLSGAKKLIERDHPLLYVENDRPEKSEALVKWLVEHGYECYWHRPPLYRENNYQGYTDNIFGDSGSQNMICTRGHDLPKTWVTEKV